MANSAEDATNETSGNPGALARASLAMFRLRWGASRATASCMGTSLPVSRGSSKRSILARSMAYDRRLLSNQRHLSETWLSAQWIDAVRWGFPNSGSDTRILKISSEFFGRTLKTVVVIAGLSAKRQKPSLSKWQNPSFWPPLDWARSIVDARTGQHSDCVILGFLQRRARFQNKVPNECSLNAGEPGHFWPGSNFGGIRLKGRSAGGWRSGLRRSEKWWRRGHVSFRASRSHAQHLSCHDLRSMNQLRVNARIDTELIRSKCGRTRSFLTGFQFRGD